MFGNVRYVALVGLLALVMGTTVLVVYQRQEMERFIEEGKSHNVAVARVFAHAIWRRFAPYLSSVATVEPGAVRVGPETAELDRWVKALRKGTPILAVNIYNLKGVTVFSTEPDRIGTGVAHEAHFLAARAGHVVSRLNLRDGHAAPSADGATRNVLETHIPVRNADGQIAAVFELHLDATELFELANRDSDCFACDMYLSACRSLQNLVPSYTLCGVF